MFKTTIIITFLTTILLSADRAIGATISIPLDQPTIQAGIDAALGGDEVVVAPGEYFENINFLGKAITVRSTDPADPSVVDATIINGNAAGTVVTFASGEGPDAVLDGLTITNGTDDEGGGVWIRFASPIVRRCTITGNSAGFGGGIATESSGALIEHCTFSNNLAVWGAGSYFLVSNQTIRDCTFIENDAADVGGGMWLQFDQVINCAFIRNSAGAVGGGVAGQASPSFINCLFVENSSGSVGGGMYIFGESPALFNCTFSGNSAGGNAGGIYYGNSGVTSEHTYPAAMNCIFWGNTPNEMFNEPTMIESGQYPLIVSRSDVQGGVPIDAWDDGGNIDVDPRFFDADSGSYWLSAGSPCIDAGVNGGVPIGITTDVAGNPRFFDDPLIADTGAGSAPIVDMGAYEYFTDCNGNGVLDSLEIGDGTSPDCNGNGVPDECDPDCNGNGVPDDCDIASGASQDCNENGIVDECDIDLPAYTMKFDGVDDYVKVNINVSEFDYTMSMWFKTTCADCGLYQVTDGVLGAGGLDRSVYLSDGNLNARLWSEETITTSGTNFADGEWHQVVHVYGESIGGQKLYVDGVERASGVKSFSDFNWQTAINIGVALNAASAYFDGEIEHVRIWHLALTSDQIAAAYASQDPVESEALRGTWTFDEEVDDQIVFDRSGTGNHGTLGEFIWFETADPMRVESPFFQGSADCNENEVPDECEFDLTAHAVAFDGVDDYIKVDVDVSEFNYSMSLWFRTDCTDCGLFQVVDDSLVALSHDRNVYLTGGNLSARLWNEETITTSGTNFADGEWHQVVHVFSSSIGGQKLYVDGVERASGVKSSSDFNWQTSIHIGLSFPATSASLDGEIEHVRIWNVALTPEQIATDYASPGPLELGWLLGSWNFDEEDDDQVVLDASGAGHHGTLGETESIESVDPVRVPSYLFGGSADCNGNGIPNSCEIADGTSEDLNGNGIPDECEAPPCPTDFDGDGSVGFADLLALLAAWGECIDCAQDLDGSGDVGFSDLLQLLVDWGECE